MPRSVERHELLAQLISVTETLKSTQKWTKGDLMAVQRFVDGGIWHRNTHQTMCDNLPTALALRLWDEGVIRR